MFSTLQAPLPTSHLSKPFLLLAGISGTGKTRFVRKQVEGNIGSLNENYCLTSVRPDWHEPSDLLGYVSRLGEKVHYVTTDVLMFIAKAWRAMVDAGLSIQEEELQGKGKYLTVTGERDTLNQMLPYWLCLDEMNLAPVEQYFADYLSVIETREWKWQGEGFTYTCDPILKPATIKQVDEKDLREALELSGVKYDAVWELICQHGMSIPLNLIVAGTVNMDETTHGFSRKVIDRALTIDFGEFFPNNIDEFFESKTQAKVLGFPTLSHAKLEHFQSVEADNRASKTQHFFQSINKVLLGTPFELAFRAFNELSLSVVSISPKNEVELAAVFDDFMMCKVLPRIEGDEDKLLDNEQNNLLEQLIEVLESQFESILLDLQRPDLFRELIDAPEKPIDVPCRSLKKLQAMNRTLENGFTSFWP
ncbi:restriction endonuclease [Vibrio breoganii]|nr:restriction endonuclease [Vibrio breoganii]PML37762.1 restriction endonuclease [Vibrio breoganii]PMO74601.1 restriction endonuclease [Vibrio breoganii]PMO93519.1 restriction endonuclease [Vibrio breoganii]PMP04603.1 restriction endonuclease [Vibrio breoganii]